MYKTHSAFSKRERVLKKKEWVSEWVSEREREHETTNSRNSTATFSSTFRSAPSTIIRIVQRVALKQNQFCTHVSGPFPGHLSPRAREPRHRERLQHTFGLAREREEKWNEIHDHDVVGRNWRSRDRPNARRKFSLVHRTRTTTTREKRTREPTRTKEPLLQKFLLARTNRATVQQSSLHIAPTFTKIYNDCKNINR